MPKTIRIGLADDHHIVRQGARSLLEAEDDIHIVGEARDGMALLQAVRAWAPDVVILDLMMPKLSGLDALPRIVQICPAIRIIAFSMYAGAPYVAQALRAGATGYVLKDAPQENLHLAVRSVLNGQRFLSPPLSEADIDAYMKDGLDMEDPYGRLTQREQEVLRLVVEGLSSSKIGECLFISPRTVEVHRNNLMRKLGMRSQTELIRFAIKRGIAPLE